MNKQKSDQYDLCTSKRRFMSFFRISIRSRKLEPLFETDPYLKQSFRVTSTIHVDADTVMSIPVVTPDTTPTRHNDGESVIEFTVVTKDFGGSVCRGFIVDVDEVEGTKTNLCTIQCMNMGIRKICVCGIVDKPLSTIIN